MQVVIDVRSKCDFLYIKIFYMGIYFCTGGVPRKEYRRIPTPKQKIIHIKVLKVSKVLKYPGRNRNFKH